MRSRAEKEEAFIQKASETFPDRFIYDEIEFTAMSKKVKLKCVTHGEIEVYPHNFLKSKYGCSHCRDMTRALTQDEFIQTCKAVHGDVYDYSQTKYTLLENTIKVICPKHGVFETPASSHQRGHGCRKCADDNLPGRYCDTLFERSPDLANKKGYLYILEFKSNNECFYKVGITRTSVTRRIQLYPNVYSIRVVKLVETTLRDAYHMEQHILKTNKQHRYTPDIDFGGRTECLTYIEGKGNDDTLYI